MMMEDNPMRYPNNNSHAIMFGKVNTNESNKSSSTYYLVNRIIVCLISIALLWTTTLQSAVTLVNYYLPAPSFPSVVDECQQTFDVTMEQRELFAECVRMQLNACSNALDVALAAETQRVDMLSNWNQQHVFVINNITQSTTSLLNLLKETLTVWSKQSVANQIPYQDTCNGPQQQSLDIYLGSSSAPLGADLFRDFAAYSRTSDATVVSLGKYSESLEAYNEWYFNNKTKTLQDLAVNIANGVALPHTASLNMSLAGFRRQFDDLIACISLDNSSNSKCSVGSSVLDEYEQLQNSMNMQLNAAEGAFREYQSVMNHYKDEVQRALGQADNFYDSIRGVNGLLSYVTGLLRKAQINIELCSSGSWCGFSKMSWFVPIPFVPDIPILHELPGPTYLLKEVKQVIPEVQAALSQAAENITRQGAEILKELDQRFQFDPSFGLNDYFPPVYEGNVSLTAKRQHELSQDVQGAMLSTINNGKASVTSTVSEEAVVINTTLSRLSFPTLSTFTLSLQELLIPKIQFGKWLGFLIYIQALLFLFDFVYRAVTTLRHVKRFWENGAVTLPIVDLRNKDAASLAWVESCCNRVVCVLQLLPFIWFELMVLIIFLALIIIAIQDFYLPVYASYCSNCVHNIPGLNGTIFNGILFSSSFAFASTAGNKDVSIGISNYNSRFSKYSREMTDSSTHMLKSAISSLQSANNTLQSNQRHQQLIENCVNILMLDELFLRACCPLNSSTESDRLSPTTYTWCIPDHFYNPVDHLTNQMLVCPINVKSGMPYAPPGEILNQLRSYNLSTYGRWFEFDRVAYDGTVGTDASTVELNDYVDPSNSSPLISQLGLKDSRFRPAAIPQCQVTCNGPSNNILMTSSKRCSCMTEWYINSHILQFCLSILVLLLQNFSRVLFCKGIVMVFWSYLDSGDIFEYRANCSREGIPCHDNCDNETGESICNLFCKSAWNRPENAIKSDTQRENVDSCNISDIEMPRESSDKRISEIVADSRGEHLNNVLRSTLAANLRQFERKGMMLICSSFVLCVPWVLLLNLLKTNIQYEPNANVS